MDFLAVQEEIQPHFLGVVLAAGLFTLGIGAYIWTFIRYGKPVGLVVEGDELPAGASGTGAADPSAAG